MKDSIVKVFVVAEKVKTPLALSGLVIVVLYLIFQKVLSLNVFSDIGSSNTFVLLQNILSMIFWLAVLAMVLGVGSYILSLVLKHKIDARSSNLQLINAGFDPRDSPYEEVTEDGKKIIRPKVAKRKKNLKEGS
jgi:hypothetical protein